jgi:hypothetical protein
VLKVSLCFGVLVLCKNSKGITVIGARDINDVLISLKPLVADGSLE